MDHPQDIGADAVRKGLAHAVASPALAGSQQLNRFLTFVVEETLAGRAELLKEYSIGVGALGRAAHFDPAADSVVRVAARQLRFKLHEFYATDGRNEPVIIELPKGGYVPVFVSRDAERPSALSDAALTAITADPRMASTPTIQAAWHASRRGLRFTPRETLALLLLVIVVVGALSPRVWRALAGPSRETATLPASALASNRSTGALSDPPAIVVLPFLNLTGTTDDDYISDGLTEEITTALANVSGLRVIARTSAFRYKGKAQDVRTIARELSANVVLEGSVTRAGNTWRVTAQLNGASDGVHLWAGTFNEKASDLLSMYDVISRHVADAIRAHLGTPLMVAQGHQGTRDPEAHALFLQGRYAWNQRNPEALKRSLAFYEQAIRRDSTYALAYAGLGDVYATMAVNNQALPGVAPPKAIAAAERALALDPSLGEAHATLGLMRAFNDWNWKGADDEFARAIALSPSYATARSWYAIALLARGRFDDALTQLHEAALLDPLSLPIRYNIAEALYNARRFDDALAQTSRAMELDGDHQYVTSLRARILTHLGRVDEARQAFAAVFDTVESAVFLDARTQHAEAREAIRRMPDTFARQSPYIVASFYARIGERDLAFAWLDRAYVARHLNLVSLKVDPSMDPVRDDPRFAAMLRNVHLDQGTLAEGVERSGATAVR